MYDERPRLNFDGLKVLGTVGLQAVVLIYYVGSTNATYNARFEAETVRFENDERRIRDSEESIQRLDRAESQILERMARLEEKQDQQLETSRRIETYVQSMSRKMAR